MAQALWDGVRGNVKIMEGGLHGSGGLPPTGENSLCTSPRFSGAPPSWPTWMVSGSHLERNWKSVHLLLFPRSRTQPLGQCIGETDFPGFLFKSVQGMIFTNIPDWYESLKTLRAFPVPF